MHARVLLLALFACSLACNRADSKRSPQRLATKVSGAPASDEATEQPVETAPRLIYTQTGKPSRTIDLAPDGRVTIGPSASVVASLHEDGALVSPSGEPIAALASDGHVRIGSDESTPFVIDQDGNVTADGEATPMMRWDPNGTLEGSFIQDADGTARYLGPAEQRVELAFVFLALMVAHGPDLGAPLQIPDESQVLARLEPVVRSFVAAVGARDVDALLGLTALPFRAGGELIESDEVLRKQLARFVKQGRKGPREAELIALRAVNDTRELNAAWPDPQPEMVLLDADVRIGDDAQRLRLVVLRGEAPKIVAIGP